MSKRLQVILAEEELAALREDAQRHGMTVSEWVRQALRTVRQASATGDAARKLAAVRSATKHSFPTADIGQMLSEIEQGYSSR